MPRVDPLIIQLKLKHSQSKLGVAPVLKFSAYVDWGMRGCLDIFLLIFEVVFIESLVKFGSFT